MLLFRIGVAAGLAAAVIGCSSSNSPGKVRGTISYKGQTVKAGTVYFMFEQGGQYRSEIKPDGSYQFTDLPTGEAKVVVDTEPFNPDQKPQVYGQKAQQYAKGMAKSMKEYDATAGRGEHAGGNAEGEKKSSAPAAGLSKEKKEELAKVYVKLPKKYTVESSTPLRYTVERGSQTKDFDLPD
jgi:hypothetical protein